MLGIEEIGHGIIPGVLSHALMLFMVIRAITLGAWYPRIARNLSPGS